MNRTPHGCLPALGLLAAAFAAPPSANPQTQPQPAYRLKVDTNLVLVPATVISPAGASVAELEREAFEIYDNGELQTLALFERHDAMPVQLVLMIDTSLSTMSALAQEKEAAVRFIREVLRPQDSAALYEFSGGVERRVDFTGDFVALEQGVLLLKSQAGTALYDAIVEASSALRKREGRRVLVIVSDGNDTTSERDFQAALRAAQVGEVGIYSLIVRPIPGESGRLLRGERVLEAMGEMTGGQVFYAESLEELDPAFGRLSDLLRTQYLLGYYPAAHELGEEFHRIEVRVRGEDYQVRHRRGYWHYTE